MRPLDERIGMPVPEMVEEERKSSKEKMWRKMNFADSRSIFSQKAFAIHSFARGDTVDLA